MNKWFGILSLIALLSGCECCPAASNNNYFAGINNFTNQGPAVVLPVGSLLCLNGICYSNLVTIQYTNSTSGFATIAFVNALTNVYFSILDTGTAFRTFYPNTNPSNFVSSQLSTELVNGSTDSNGLTTMYSSRFANISNAIPVFLKIRSFPNLPVPYLLGVLSNAASFYLWDAGVGSTYNSNIYTALTTFVRGF